VDTDPGSILRGRARLAFQGFFAISASNSPARPSAKSLISGALFLKFEIARLLGIAADSFALSRSCFTSSTQWAGAIALRQRGGTRFR